MNVRSATVWSVLRTTDEKIETFLFSLHDKLSRCIFLRVCGEIFYWSMQKTSISFVKRNTQY